MGGVARLLSRLFGNSSTDSKPEKPKKPEADVKDVTAEFTVYECELLYNNGDTKTFEITRCSTGSNAYEFRGTDFTGRTCRVKAKKCATIPFEVLQRPPKTKEIGTVEVEYTKTWGYRYRIHWETWEKTIHPYIEIHSVERIDG